MRAQIEMWRAQKRRKSCPNELWASDFEALEVSGTPRGDQESLKEVRRSPRRASRRYPRAPKPGRRGGNADAQGCQAPDEMSSKDEMSRWDEQFISSAHLVCPARVFLSPAHLVCPAHLICSSRLLILSSHLVCSFHLLGPSA